MLVYEPCTGSQQIKIEPIAKPEITSDYLNTCHGNPPATSHYITNLNNNLTMPYEGNLTYTYQILSATGLIPITTNPFSVSWYGNEDGGILEITATHNVYDCPQKEQIKIYSCCEGPTDLHYNDTTLTTNPTGNFTVNGTLTINGNIDIEEKEVYFAPGARIVINPNKTLDIMKSTLEAYCDTMWDGIYISGTGQLNIETSVISDAKNAVVSQEGGDFQISNETTFKNNYKGIVVEAYDDAHPGSITETTFICDATLLPQYPPVTATRTFSGIELYDVLDDNSFFEIGESTSGMMNYFDNMDYGIISYRSKIKVINNTFTDITEVLGSETAVLMQGFEDSNNSKAIIGGYNTYDPNYFDNVCFGVAALQNMDVDILNNEFSEPYYGILIHDAAEDNTVSINSNTIDYPVLVGIWGNNNEWCSTEILANEITMSGTGWFGSGIILGEQVPDNANAYYEVGGNTITAPVVNGISGTNLQSPLITNNIITSIPPSANSRIGITLTNCDEAEVTDNSIYYSSSSAYDVNGGIYASLCDEALFECNHILEAGYGIRCDGYMPSTLKQNHFDDNDKGLWLTNDGEIGAQGDMNTNYYNIWDANDTWDTYTSGNPYTDGSLSPFYVRNNAYEKPSNNGSAGLSVPITFNTSNNTDDPIACSSSQSMMSGSGSSNFSSLICESIADGSKTFSNASSEWLAQNAVYQKLIKDTVSTLQLSQNNILQNFKDSVSQAAMGQLESVNKQLAQYNLTQSQLQSLYNYNLGITATNAIEENAQAVNAILIDMKHNNKKSPDSLQLAFLKDLAWKCPFIDGKSVYQARAMLAYYDDITVIYFNSCEYELINDSKRMAVENENEVNTVIEPSITVYPNPASTKLTIDITCGDYTSAEFILYNALGQGVMVKNLEANTKSLSIDISMLKIGFYNYAFRINNERIAFDKIIVIR